MAGWGFLRMIVLAPFMASGFPALAAQFTYRCPFSGYWIYMSFDDIANHAVFETATSRIDPGKLLGRHGQEIKFSIARVNAPAAYLTLDTSAGTLWRDRDGKRTLVANACEMTELRPSIKRYDLLRPN